MFCHAEQCECQWGKYEAQLWVLKTHKKCQVVIWKMPTVRNANWQDWRRSRVRSGDRGLSLTACAHHPPRCHVSPSLITKTHKTRIHFSKHSTQSRKDRLRNEILCSRARHGVTKRPKLFGIRLLFCWILNWLNYLIEVSYCMQEPVETS